MKCKNCKYYNRYKKMCYVTHLYNTISCNATSYEQIEKANICYNCKYWLGGGDWGLSCEKDYWNCSANGFDEICGEFERKVNEDDN